MLSATTTALAVLVSAASAVQLQHGAGRPVPQATASLRCRSCRAVAAAADPTLGVEDDWLTRAKHASPADDALLAPMREKAADELQYLNFPRRKEEAWRRCDLSSLRAANVVAPPAVATAELRDMLAACSDEVDSAGMRLVVVDGVCNSELSDLSELPSSVYVGSLGGAEGSARQGALAVVQGPLPEDGADPRTSLGCYTFAALNQASFSDVVSVHVPPGVAVERPLHVVFISTGVAAGSEADSTGKRNLPGSHPNVVVTVGDGSSLSMLQQYAGSGAYFVNGLSRVRLGEGAKLMHSYVQEQSGSSVHIDSVTADVGAGATYESQLLQSGGRVSRTNVLVSLNGPGAHTDLRGLTLGAESQLADVHSRIVHASPDCTSAQEQRNAVAGTSRVVWKGAVVVPPGADNTTANQLCRTLLLSDDARVDVSPALEIDTDDVECTHGATISDLDDEMIFYLQARGLSRLDARVLLLTGWSNSALEAVPALGAKRRAAAKAATLAPESERAIRRESLSSI